jgi:DNA-directed RNA polymerase specialized sigma24 family protein
MAVLLLGDRPSAEDVVHEAFLGLFRGLGRLGDPGRAVAYLRIPVLNGCRSVLRARRRAKLPGPRHLDDEEQKVVPLAAVTLTQQEWDAMGKHGVGQIPRNKTGIAFGMMLDPLGEADRAFMMRSLPAPVRMLYAFLIERPWKKYASTLRTGT